MLSYAMEEKPISSGKYMGTYPMRSIGHGQNGIHMPVGLVGDYAIYLHCNGRIELVPLKQEG
jgi:hypothetical protein